MKKSLLFKDNNCRSLLLSSKILAVPLLMFFMLFKANGQTITTTLTNNNGSSVIVFTLQNTNAFPIQITEMASAFGTTATQTVHLYALPVATFPTAAPPTVTAANGWSVVATNNNFAAIANTTGSGSTTQTCLTGMSYVVPASSVVRLALQSVTGANALPFTTTGGSMRYSSVGTQTPNSFSNSGVNIFTATIHGQGGTMTSFIADRGFVGKLTFAPLVPCAGEPTTPTIPSVVNICNGASYNYAPVGATFALGIVYSWEDSSATSGAWNTYSVTPGPSLNLPAQTTNLVKYFRLKTICNGTDSSYSNVSEFNVNYIPNVSAVSTGTTACTSTGRVATASSTDAITPNYTWLPNEMVGPNIGATVNLAPLPFTTKTYTVTATTAAGCTKTTTVGPILSVVGPNLLNVNATPNSICVGNISTLTTLVGGVPSLVRNYSYAPSTGTYNAILGTSGAIAVPGVKANNTFVNNLPIGFSFNFNGTNYSSFNMSSSGFISFGPALTASNITNSSTSTLVTAAPLWDNIGGALAGTGSYQLSGVAPNRVLTVEWDKYQWLSTATAPCISFQVKLYETTNKVEFHYRQESGTLVTPTATIGLTGGTAIVASNYIVLSNGTATATSSNTVANNAIAAKPPTNQVYTFTPPTAPIYSYDWQPASEIAGGANTNPSADADLLNSLTSSNFTVSITDPNTGCSAVGNVFVNLAGGSGAFSQTVPKLTFPSGQLNGVCNTFTVNIKDTALNAGAPFTWTLKYPAASAPDYVFTSSTVNTFDYTFTPTLAQSGVYTLEIADACGNNSSQTVNVTVNPIPVVAVSSNLPGNTICGVGSALLTATGASTYTWTPNANLTNNTGSTTNASPIAGTTYTVTGTDINGCVSSSNILVTFDATPILSPNASPASVCLNSSSTLAANAVANSGPQTTPLPSCTPNNVPISASYFINSIITAGAVVNINNVSGQATNTYQNFFNDPTKLLVALPSSTFTLNGVGGSGTFGWTVYIDFDRDGVFNLTNERLFNTTGYVASIAAPISIPSTAIGIYRMRIVNNFLVSTNVEPCNTATNPTYGETEDYKISIGYPTTPIATYAWSPNTFLNDSTLASPIASNVTSSQVYTVTVTQGSGCSTSSTVAINAGTTFSATAISASLGNTQCGGLNNTLSISGAGGGLPYAYSWTNSANATVATSQTLVFNGNASTTYTCVISDACGASFTETFAITVNPAPSPVISTVPAIPLVCGTGSVTLNVTNGDTFVWSPSSSLSAATGSSVSASPTASTVYTVVATETAFNCTSSTTVSVLQEQSPTWISTVANPANVCVNGISILTATAEQLVSGPQTTPAPSCTPNNVPISATYYISNVVTTGGVSNISNPTGQSPNTYTNYFSTKTMVANPNATIGFTLTGNTGGTYGWSVFVDFDRNGVFNLTNERILNSTGYVASITGSAVLPATALGVYRMRVVNNFLVSTSLDPCNATNPTYGETEDYRLVVEKRDPITNPNIVWTESNPGAPTLGSSTGGSNATIPMTTNTTYTVVATAPLGCSISTTLAVSVGVPISNILPASNNVSNTFCEGQTVTLSAPFSGGSPSFNYTWSNTSGPVGLSATYSFIASATTAGIYTINVVDACGSSISATISIIVNPAPPVAIASIPASAIICGSGTVTLTASGADTYSWSNAATLSAATGTSVVASPPATTVYTVTGTEAAFGCTATKTFTVLQEAIPSFVTAVANPNNVCVGAASTLTATAEQLISGPQGLVTGYCVPNFVPISATYFIANVTTTGGVSNISNPTGQSPTTYTDYYNTKVLVANPNATIGFTAAGNSTSTYGWGIFVDLDRNGVFNTTNERIYNSTGYLNAISGSFVLPATALGVYRMRIVNNFLVSTNLDPCNTATNPTYGETEDYKLVVEKRDPIPGSAITWLESNIVTPTLATTTGGSVNANNIPSTQIYTVTATAPLGCTITTTLSVLAGVPFVVNPITATLGNSQCAGLNNTLSITAAGGGQPYSYLWSNSANANIETTASVLFNGTSSATYTCVVTDNCGASASQTFAINVNALPNISIASTLTNGIICGSGTNTLTAAGASTYVWSPATGLSATTGANVTASTFVARTYTVTGTDANGCISTSSSTVSFDALRPIAITAVPAAVCPDGSSTLTAVLSNPGGPTTIVPICTTTSTGTPLHISSTNCINQITLGTYTSPLNTACVNSGSGNPDFSYSTWTVTSVGGPIQNLIPGNTYTLQVNPGANSTGFLMAWIDYNRDGNLVTTPNEFITPTPVAMTASTIFNLPFTVPATATPGYSILRLRTRTLTQANTTACDSYGSGETEDYVVNIGLIASAPVSYAWSPSTNLSAPTTLSTGVSNITASGVYTLTVTQASGCTNTNTVAITAYPTPTITATAANTIVAAGGSSTLTAAGGATYAWTPSAQISGSASTSTVVAVPSAVPGSSTIYTVNAIDLNGCTGTSVASVAVATLPTLAITPTNPLCFGTQGSAGISVTDGLAPITITLNGNPVTGGFAPNLTAGTYTAIATDALGQVVSTVFTLVDPALLTLSATATDASCFGGFGTISASSNGGTLPVNILVNGNPIGSSYPAGTYTVSAIDANNCSVSTTVLIGISSNLAITTSSNHALCFNTLGTVTYAVSGGSAPYQVFNGAAVVAASPASFASGSYTLVVVDAGGCTNSATFSLNPAPSEVKINSVLKSDVLCSGGSTGNVTMTASGGTGAITYASVPAATQTTPGVFTGLSGGTYLFTATDANGCTATTNVTVLQPATMAFVAPVIYAPSYCVGNNGVLSVWANGGTGVKTYSILPSSVSSISGTFNGLSQGTYTVTATDINNCTSTQTYTLTNTPAISVSSASATNPGCVGGTGSASIVATGGTPSLSYLIAPAAVQSAPGSFTNLAAGTYTLTVKDARNCSVVSTVSVVNPAPISFMPLVQTAPLCNGAPNGAVSVAATGGSGTYSFTLTPALGIQPISGTFANLPSAIYVVRATDANNCTKTMAFALAQPAKLSFSSITKTNVTCNGGTNGSIAAIPKGGVGAKTFSISPVAGTVVSNGVTNLPSNQYTLSVTDANACSASTSVVLTQPTAILWSNVVSVNPTSASTGSIVVSATGGTGTKSYAINPTGTQPAAGSFSGLSANTYTVTATDTKSCSTTTVVSLVQVMIVVKDEVVGEIVNLNSNGKDDIVLFPNPTSGPLTLSVYAEVEMPVRINILDASGRKFKTIESMLLVGSNTINLDLKDVPNGSYLVQILRSGIEPVQKKVNKF